MRVYEFLIEALTPEQITKLYKDLGSKYDTNIHDNIFKGKSRIYAPLEDQPSSTGEEISSTQKELQTKISDLGYEIDDYKRGLAKKSSDSTKKIKIGKLIKDKELLNKFANDPIRAATRQATPLMVVFSRDPVDIAGMSTDRGWVSCMDLNDGPTVNNKYIPADIKNGAIIAYLIRENDKNIDNPLGRILIKPYYYKNHMVLFPDSVYGTNVAGFREVVNKFCKFVNSNSPEGNYRLRKTSHSDSHSDIRAHYDFSKIDVSKMTLRAKKLIADRPEVPPEQLMLLAKDKDMEVRDLVASNRNTPPEALMLLAKDPVVSIQLHVASNISTPPEALMLLAKNTWNRVRANVVTNPNTPHETLMLLFKDYDDYVRDQFN
jgi:hypothetical protein